MRKNQIYTEEFKQGAIKMVLEQNMSRSDVGRRLGTCAKNVSRWVREHLSEQENSSSGNNIKELISKNKELEKENKRLRMEREILKKAAAFFANEYQ